LTHTVYMGHIANDKESARQQKKKRQINAKNIGLMLISTPSGYNAVTVNTGLSSFV